MSHTAFIALGSNLDDPYTHVVSAFGELDTIPLTTVVKRSGIYESEPYGVKDQPNFINAVAEVTTQLSPFELLEQLQQIENRHKRVRTMHWGPRTLDLDLIMYEQQIIDTEKLKLPHPGMALRSFVLKPLMDLNPELMTPLNQTVRELFSRIDCSDLKLKSNDLQ